jgi:YidC/Oxa1 family membrane protein insertase
MISSRGAAVDLAILNRFKRTVDDSKTPYYFEQPYLSGGPMAAALGTRWVTIDGLSRDLWNENWALRSDPKSDSVAVYAVELVDAAGKKLLTIEKHFELKEATSPTLGYEFDVTYDLINTSGRPLKVKLAFNGANTPAIENNRDIAELFAGYDDRNTVTVPDPHPILNFKDHNEVDLKTLKDFPFLWTGMRSNYFDAIVRTGDAAGPLPGPWAKVYAQAQANAPDKVLDKDVAIGFETDELTLPSADPRAIPLHVYFGPTQRSVLESKYYSSFPLSYDQTLVVASGMYGFCTFPQLVNGLVGLLRAFHYVTHDWGLAIIILVIIVRLILHPITKKSQVSMTRMSKMGPEMEKLKKKYADDKEGLNKAMMGYYREQGVTPILGCLPMFLQMPIWIALWNALQSTFEIRHASFLWGLTWIKDLAQPDHLYYFPAHPISLLIFHFDAINVLPILMGVVFFIQQKLTPKPDPKTLSPEQAQQQKMMQWMSLLFPLFLYNSPSGLNLYILTSTTIGIIEAKRIRDHIKEREELEKAGKLVPKAANAGGFNPMGWVMGKFAELQARAEDVRREAERGGKKKA